MIATVALIAWIIVSAALFALMKPIRAFSLAYLVGILLLPAPGPAGDGIIAITQSLRIEKFTACNLGALIGTLVFCPHVFSRYRFGFIDVAYAAALVSVFCTSLVNGLGPYDGASCAFNEARTYLPMIILAKAHIATVGDLYQFLRAVVGGAFVYGFVAMFEWRMSPQLHTWVWGYFPHSFDQFIRQGMLGVQYQMFRPLGMFRHALEMAGFLSVGGALAIWLWYKKMFPPLWGLVPAQWVVAVILLGLLSTLTFSGYIACAMMVGLLVLIQLRWKRGLLLVLPIAIALWMAGRYTNVFEPSLLQATANALDAERGASLEYRLDAEEKYLAVARANPFFGLSSTYAKGTTAQSIADNRPTEEPAGEKKGGLPALDGFWLIQVAFNGLIGLGTMLLVWTAAIWMVFRRWRALAGESRVLVVFVAVALGAQLVDFLFNAFPSPVLLIANAGVCGLLHAAPQAVRRPMGTAAEVSATLVTR